MLGIDKQIKIMVCVFFAVAAMSFFTPSAHAAKKNSDLMTVESAKDTLQGSMGCAGTLSSDRLLCVEKIMPKKIRLKKPFDYTIRVTNLGDCSLDDVVVSEKISEKWNLIKAVPEATKTSDRWAEWGIGALEPKEVRLIQVTAKAQDKDATKACTKATFQPLLCVKPEAMTSDLKVALEMPSQPLLCDPVLAKVTVQNTGKTSLANVKVTLPLAEGWKTQDGKNSYGAMIGTLEAGASKTETVPLKVSKPGSYQHEAVAEAAGDFSAESGSIETLVRQPVMKVIMDGPAKVLVNKNTEYKIVVTNTGDAGAGNTVVTLQTPASMKFVSASNNGAAAEGKITWKVGDLAPKKDVTLNATYKNDAEGIVQPKAMVTGNCCAEAGASMKTEVEGIAALHLESADAEDPIQMGGVETFRVTVENQGSSAAKYVILKIAFGKNFNYLSASGPTGARAESQKEVEFAPMPALEPKQKAVWEIKAKAIEEGDHLLHVSVKSDGGERSVEKTEPTRVF